MSNRTVFIVSFYLSLAAALNLFGQSRNYEVFQLRFMYDEIKFPEVIIQGNKLLANQNLLSKKELAEIHKYMALAFFNLSQKDSSRAHFYALLSIKPDFKPDPIRTSPKIIRFFNTIKQSFKLSIDTGKAVPFRQYIFVQDIRPQAALRSLILPGWGQFYKKDRSKGYIFGAAFWGGAAITGLTYSLEKKLHSKYLNERNPDKVNARYDDYNTMSKTRRIMQYTVLATWAVAVADALFSDYNPDLEINPSPKGITLRFAL